MNRIKRLIPIRALGPAILTVTAPLAGVAALPVPVPRDTAAVHLHGVEVTASATARDAASAAPRFTLGAERMHREGITDMGTALRRLPGINVRDYGGAGGMKTVSVRGLGANHTGVAYDGVAVSDCQGGQIDLSRYDLDNVASMGLSIGDGGDIFTSARTAASASVINIETRSVPAAGDMHTRLDARLTAGSFGLVRPYISVGRNLSHRLGVAADASFTHALNDYPYTLPNGSETTRGRRINSLMNSGRGEATVRFRPRGSMWLEAKGHFYRSHRQLPGQVVLYNPGSNERLDEANAFGQLRFGSGSLGDFRIKATAKYNRDKSHYTDRNAIYPGGLKNDEYRQREASAGGVVMWQPHGADGSPRPVSASYAADWMWNRLHSSAMSGMSERNTLLQTVAVRWQHGRLEATARALLTLAREHEPGSADRSRSRLSPSLSASWRPLAAWPLRVRIAYKEIFRLPTFNDMYYFRTGSRELKPEDTRQANLGLTWAATGYGPFSLIEASADAYLNSISNKIVAIPKNTFIWSMSNVGKARSRGLDLTLRIEAQLTASQRLTASANYSLQRVEARTSPYLPDYGCQLAYTPVHSGAGALGWENPWVNVTAGVSGAGERFGTNSNLPVSRLSPYAECSVTLWRDFRLRRTRLRLELSAQNLTDTQYEIISGYPMPGRRLQGTVSLEL